MFADAIQLVTFLDGRLDEMVVRERNFSGVSCGHWENKRKRNEVAKMNGKIIQTDVLRFLWLLPTPQALLPFDLFWTSTYFDSFVWGSTWTISKI